ncbi:hypothetical protein [Clostridium ganghwense]|uniref:Uncharacterized protein n=1 Tax=Clostridium ganghwense TaxID=312089 RepID=A0ABT4CU82_9CLOT|nr:hypothetical protein [Clostridium ganghwense]MCY6372483.1 hypothetical protein [Clostridium ganghwense]
MDKNKLDIKKGIKIFNSDNSFKEGIVVDAGTKTVKYIKNFTDEQYKEYVGISEKLHVEPDVMKGIKIYDELEEWLTKNNISKYMQEQMDKKYEIEFELEIMQCEPQKEGNVVALNPKYIDLRRKQKEQENIDKKFVESIVEAINNGKLTEK